MAASGNFPGLDFGVVDAQLVTQDDRASIVSQCEGSVIHLQLCGGSLSQVKLRYCQRLVGHSCKDVRDCAALSEANAAHSSHVILESFASLI